MTNEAKVPHSPLPWRSVYPLGSKQRCAAVMAGDHYVYLWVAESDAMLETIQMHQANADLIAATVNASDPERIARLEADRGACVEALRSIRSGVLLMVPEPQKSGFMEIIAPALARPESEPLEGE